MGPIAIALVLVAVIAGAPPDHMSSNGSDSRSACGTDGDLQTTIDGVPAGSTVRITGICRGPISIDRSMIIEGRGTDPTLIGDAEALRPLITVSPGADVVVRGIILVGNRGGDSIGGAISNAGRLVLDHVEIRGNSASRCGAIANEGEMHVIDSRIEQNHADHRAGAICNTGSLKLEGTSVIANTAERTGQIESRGDLEIIDSIVAAGVAGNGGSSAIASEGTLTIIDSSVRGHSSTGGGTIAHDGDMRLIRSVISGNVGLYGALRIVGSATIVDSRIVGNRADDGSAGVTGGTLTILRSEIQDR